MSNHDDFNAGLHGGPRSNSASFLKGESLRHVREFNKTVSDLMAPPAVTPGPAGSNILNQPGWDPNAPTRTYKRGVFDAWDVRPRLSMVTFLVAVAVSLAFVWPALDAAGTLPSTFLRIVLLGGACLFLSSWTKALPFISTGGALLLLAYGMMLG